MTRLLASPPVHSGCDWSFCLYVRTDLDFQAIYIWKWKRHIFVSDRFVLHDVRSTPDPSSINIKQPLKLWTWLNCAICQSFFLFLLISSPGFPTLSHAFTFPQQLENTTQCTSFIFFFFLHFLHRYAFANTLTKTKKQLAICKGIPFIFLTQWYPQGQLT